MSLPMKFILLLKISYSFVILFFMSAVKDSWKSIAIASDEISFIDNY